MRSVKPEYDDAVRVFAGFDKDTWTKINDTIKVKFDEAYNTVRESQNG